MGVRDIKYYLSYDRELRLIIKNIVAVAGDKEHKVLRVLDVGCGTTSMLSELASDKNLRSKFCLVGLDVYKPTIEWNKINGIHDEYILDDIRNHDPVEKYDIVVATDLIEHFEKEEARVLLGKLESMAVHLVVLITPNGYRENIPLDGNLYMEHKCGFSARDLRTLSYSVLGAGGLRFMRKMYSLPRGNRKIMNVVLYFMSRIFRYFPALSYHLVAVKAVS